MTFFLLFTLAVREDNPLQKYMSWLPNNRVISMVLEWKNAVNEFYPKKIVFLEKAKSELKKSEPSVFCKHFTAFLKFTSIEFKNASLVI